jgi:polyisoprenoid-binding protein YceI
VMVRRHVRSALLTGLALAGVVGALGAAAPQAVRPLAIDTARVTIAGMSNIHAYTASTTTVRVTRVVLSSAVAGPAFWDAVVKPGALETFDVAIPATQLTSPKEGLDKNMHKALKVQEHADITFRLAALEPGATAGTLKARGVLRIAGVERDVVLDLTTERRESTLTVKGKLDLLMTDYGIKPPTAMLGMLKTEPKVTVTFETVLAVPLT